VVRNQEVETIEIADGPSHEFGTAGRITQIRFQGNTTNPMLLGRVSRLVEIALARLRVGRTVRQFFKRIAYDEVASFPSQREDEGSPYAPRGPSDDCRPSLKAWGDGRRGRRSWIGTKLNWGYI
jgi:hypothetical protein